MSLGDQSLTDPDAGDPNLTGPDASDPDGSATDAREPVGSTPEGSAPSDPDGQFDSQDMPTTDGQMASGTSEEVVPPRAD
jgi:hypothetical protein